MSNTNIVVLTGNLGDDVDFRVFPQTGNGVAELRIAVNKHRRNQETGGFDTCTSWVTVRMFGKLAERANEKLLKGAKVTVTGELTEDRWNDQKTGQKRSKLYVVANSFEFLGGGGTRVPQGEDQGDSSYQGQSLSPSNQGGQRSYQGKERQENDARQNRPAQQTNTGTRPTARPAGY